MEILDAQVHVDRVIPDGDASVDTLVDATLAAMDAVGVDTVLIAEIGGAGRPDHAVSQRAVQRRPDRFGYLVSLEHGDPDLDRRMAEVRATPGCLCLRLIPWPQNGDLDGHLRRVIDAFGAERVLWASDFTESRPHTWAQSLHYLLYSEQLSESEKAWVLGRSARAVLGWPRG